MTYRLSFPGRTALALGSAILALKNPARADMVAVLGEVTGSIPLNVLRRRMMQREEGREMITSLSPARFPEKGSDSLPALRAMPDGSLGREYARFMDKRRFEPESRLAVKFIEDPQDAWVMQRYRDVHDLWHVLTGMPTNVLGELAQKWFEAVQTGLPVAALSALVGPVRLSQRQRNVLFKDLVPWAVSSGRTADDLLAIRYEDYLTEDVHQLRKKWNIELPNVSDREVLFGKKRKK